MSNTLNILGLVFTTAGSASFITQAAIAETPLYKRMNYVSGTILGLSALFSAVTLIDEDPAKHDAQSNAQVIQPNNNLLRPPSHFTPSQPPRAMPLPPSRRFTRPDEVQRNIV